MSTGSTSNYSLPYPLSTDPVNVAGDIEDLATELDLFLTNPVFINDVKIDGGDITTDATTASVFNATATTLNIGEAATAINIGSSSGQTDFRGNVNIATGKQYEINNVSVLTATTLGSSVVNSSLTSVGTIATGTWNATTIAVNKGGTGLTSYTTGDIVYASGSTTLAKLAGVATGNSLISGGVGAAPSWGKIGLATHVSGTLPVANGGTGVTSSTGTGNVVLSASPTLTGTPLAPTAAVDTNTTQIATTAYVVGQGYIKGNQTITLSGDATGSGTTAITVTVVNDSHSHSNSTITSVDASKISSGTLGIARGGTGVSSTPTNGQLLIGNGSGFSLATLTAGTNISITNAGGSITIDATGGGGTIGLESVLMFAGM